MCEKKYRKQAAKRIISFAAAFCMAILLPVSAGALAEKEQANSLTRLPSGLNAAELEEKIDAYVKENEETMAAMSVAVFTAKDSLLEKAYGYTDKENSLAATEESVYEWGSCTKLIITQAMFMNCDHSMLTYRFYRQPKALLSLFVERLKYITLINLLPAAVIAIALPLLLYITGGTDEPMNYVLLFVSIIAMSVFFSVHHMVLYYLLQPYNVNLETKSAAYGIVNWVTYFICYAGIQVRLPTMLFGSVISIFCVLYAVIAFVLAYRLAPRTFKLRQ